MADVRRVLIEIDAETGNVVGGIANVNKQLSNLGSNAKVATKEVSKAAKAMQKDLAGSAGIAGAAATELGRTISDMPFGITAVTNNISQLGNMFALLVTSAGSVEDALKALRTALVGPVGILIAFQAIVAGIELFAQHQRKAKKETDDLKNSIEEINELYGNQRARLIALGNAAIFGSESQRKALAENMKEVKAYLEAAETTGEVTSKVIDEAIRLGLNLIEARRNAAIAEQEYLEAVNTSGRDSTAAALKFAEASQKVVEAQKALNLEKQEDILLTGEISEKEEERIRLQEAALRRLQDQTDKFIKDKEASEIAQLDRAYQREIEAAKKVGADTTNIDEFYANEKLRVKEEFAEKRARNERETNYKIESAQRNHAIKMAQLEAQLAGNRIKESDRTEKEILDAEIRILESRIMVLRILAKTFDVSKKQLDEALIVLDDLIARRELVAEDTTKKILGINEEDLKAAIEATQTALTTLGDVFAAQAEREIAIETNKTNALNDQLRQRLANEQLSADERDKINQQIARNEAELVRKENEINKKRFEQEKAVNIALATVNTFSAATGVLSETKGGSFARIAGMIAVIGAGLAQVAMIAKQEFQAKALPSPSLSGLGGSTGTNGPSFNVVGSSGQNQLSAAIARLESQPIKAFVVSSDVTTAQQLDRSIIQGASI